jgi:epoxide hydrolase-like predicted phosphatase
VSARIEAIVSDFGGVLTTPLFQSFLRFQESHGVPLETLGQVMQQIADRDGENPLYPLERGEMTEADFLALLGDALRAELGRDIDMGGFAESYFAGLDTNHVFVDWLRDARERRGLRLALLTNNVREWEARWRAMLPVDELFETVVDSAFVGLRKPDPRIYELTLERLRLPAEACAFVDDFEHNCAAAAELGMHAVVFSDTDQAIADLEALLG